MLELKIVDFIYFQFSFSFSFSFSLVYFGNQG